jgi:hypothetical protein
LPTHKSWDAEKNETRDNEEPMSHALLLPVIGWGFMETESGRKYTTVEKVQPEEVACSRVRAESGRHAIETRGFGPENAEIVPEIVEHHER